MCPQMSMNDRYNLELATRNAIHDKLLNSDTVRDRLLQLDSILGGMNPKSEEYKDRFLMLVEMII